MAAQLVVYVLGAPGSGKSTQCELIREQYSWAHISLGDLLRQEAASNPALAGTLEQGQLAPTELVMELLLKAMASHNSSSSCSKFLLDGFPRTLEQLEQFEDQVRPADHCLYFSLPEEEAKQRLLSRGRPDDTEESIARRIAAFREQTQPVIEALAAAGRLTEVPADGPVEAVFERLVAVVARLDSLAESSAQESAADASAAARLESPPKPAAAAEEAADAADAGDTADEQEQSPGEPSQGELQAEASAASAAVAGIASQQPSRPASAMQGATGQQGVPDGALLRCMPSQAGDVAGPEGSQGQLSAQPSQAGSVAGAAAPEVQASQQLLSAQPSQAGSVAGAAAREVQASQQLLSAQPSQAGSVAGAVAGGFGTQASQQLLSAQASQAPLSAQPSQAGSTSAAAAAPEEQGSQATLSAQASHADAAAQQHASQGELHGEASQTGSIAGAPAASISQQGSQAVLSVQHSASRRPASADPGATLDQAVPPAQASQNGSIGAPAMAPEASQTPPSAEASQVTAAAPLGQQEASQQLLSAQPSQSSSTRPASAVSQQHAAGHEASQLVGQGSAATLAAAPAAGAADAAYLQQLKAQLSSMQPPLVVCGPSGVGKGTLINKLMAQYPDRFGFSVSHTTRGPRPGEEDGKHYHFSDRATVEAQVAQGLFLEHADVHGNMYGTSLAALADVGRQGKMCVLDIDVQGAQQVKQSVVGQAALFLFVAPPSEAELERRLRGRGTETEDKILKRLANAKSELAKAQEPGFFHAVVVNDDLDAAYYQLKLLIEQLAPGTVPEVRSEAPAQAAPAATLPSNILDAQEPHVAAAAANPLLAALPAAAPAAIPANATPLTKAALADLISAAKAATRGSAGTLYDMGGLAAMGLNVGGVNGSSRAMPVRAYMDSTVVPVLREGLKALNKERPEDPLQFLADFLVAHKRAMQPV